MGIHFQKHSCLIISAIGYDLKENGFEFDVLARFLKDTKKRDGKKNSKCGKGGCNKRRCKRGKCNTIRSAKNRNLNVKRKRKLKCKDKKGRRKCKSIKEQ